MFVTAYSKKLVFLRIFLLIILALVTITTMTIFDMPVKENQSSTEKQNRLPTNIHLGSLSSAITLASEQEIIPPELTNPIPHKFYIQVAVNALHVRSGPTTESQIIRLFRKGMVVEVIEIKATDEEIWYKIQQPNNLRYPGRIKRDWFIAGKYDNELLVRKIEEKETMTFLPSTLPIDKLIRISLSKQLLQAFEKERMVLETSISTGKLTKEYKTPNGEFKILRKKISAYMQGPLPGDDEYFDLPGIPYTMYFTSAGHAIHGCYWHNNFGNPMSHGCVNLFIEEAEPLYWWTDIGTKVIII